jgi:hypothetical protein
MHFDRGSLYMDVERERQMARHPRASGDPAQGTPWIPAYAAMTILPYARYVCSPECITRSRAFVIPGLVEQNPL